MRRNLFGFIPCLNHMKAHLAVLFLFCLVSCVPSEDEGTQLKIESLSPESGLVSGGFELTIQGQGFSFVESVTINGVSCSDLSVS